MARRTSAAALEEAFEELDELHLLDMIASLLAHPQSERRVAAAIVLGELEADTPNVLDGLREACKDADDAGLRAEAAVALGNIAPKSVVKDLRPLLKDPDEKVRSTVREVFAHGKGIETEDIERMLNVKDERQRLGAISVLGARGGSDARRALLAQLPDGTVKTHEAVLEALRPHLSSLEDHETGNAVAEIEVLLEDASDYLDHFAAPLVQLLEVIENDSVEDVLLSIGEKAGLAPEARVAAIEALRRSLGSIRSAPRVFKFLLNVLEDKSTPPLVQNAAVDTLSGLDVPVTMEARVRTLTLAGHTQARRWAIRALGAQDTVPAARALAAVWFEGDPTDRSLALEAGMGTVNGRRALARALAQEKNLERAHQLVAGLKEHSKDLTPTILSNLEDSVVSADPEVAKVVVDLLRQVGGRAGGRVQGNLLEKGLELKEQGNYSEAVQLLRRLVQGPDATAESCYQLGVCQLKVSRCVVSRGASNDPCMGTFKRLLKYRDFQMIKRLEEERILQLEELFYLGFSLSEEKNEAHQGLGGDILMHLAENHEASKLGRRARNKLATMGWID